ncbi:uncharacterized protein G2W53_016753 [Senna tora]|uniref:Uncharacterized protein n=1 Tax=Senna tora TaxID=362788 RepID=A0A834WQG7_9FABA|nr:uncharacterized protein G2W53_016753 [Senna tora]
MLHSKNCNDTPFGRIKVQERINESLIQPGKGFAKKLSSVLGDSPGRLRYGAPNRIYSSSESFKPPMALHCLGHISIISVNKDITLHCHYVIQCSEPVLVRIKVLQFLLGCKCRMSEDIRVLGLKGSHTVASIDWPCNYVDCCCWRVPHGLEKNRSLTRRHRASPLQSSFNRIDLFLLPMLSFIPHNPQFISLLSSEVMAAPSES